LPLSTLSADSFAGAPLIGELSGLWRIKVRRFRIVCELGRKARAIGIFAIGHRREVYEQVADRLRQIRARK
jgi:mRNA-degrading endonuclease RelE of RelBE toxin-antitoxin system